MHLYGKLAIIILRLRNKRFYAIYRGTLYRSLPVYDYCKCTCAYCAYCTILNLTHVISKLSYLIYFKFVVQVKMIC